MAARKLTQHIQLVCVCRIGPRSRREPVSVGDPKEDNGHGG